MYYNLWNIRKATSGYSLYCSSDQGTFKKAKWKLGSRCPSSHSTLKTSIASRILTTTGDPASPLPPFPNRLSRDMLGSTQLDRNTNFLYSIAIFKLKGHRSRASKTQRENLMSYDHVIMCFQLDLQASQYHLMHLLYRSWA
jgi:hypothetical protein